jgi:cytochrome c oxidase subunit 2
MNPGFALLGLPLPAASDHAAGVDVTIGWLLAVSAAAVCLLGTLTIFILVRYRRSSKASRTPVKIAEWKLETAWSIVTLAIFLGFFWRGAQQYLSAAEPPEGAGVIQVTGRQWMWDSRYSNGRREFNALHLRLGESVRLVLRSEDVIHSFYVPAFRVKEDLVPGKVTSIWFRPTRVGNFALYCAQFCGSAHANMTGTVIVLEAAAYERWAAERSIPMVDVSPAARGRAIYVRFGCGNCHDGSEPKGPPLAGIFGSSVIGSGGRHTRVNDSFLHDAILYSTRVPGYRSSMPTYAGIVTEADVSDLVLYIESLRTPKEIIRR